MPVAGCNLAFRASDVRNTFIVLCVFQAEHYSEKITALLSPTYFCNSRSAIRSYSTQSSSDFSALSAALRWSASKKQCYFSAKQLSFPRYYHHSFTRTCPHKITLKVVDDDTPSSMKETGLTDELIKWTQDNKMLINSNKTKEMILGKAKPESSLYTWRLLESKEA